VGRGGTHTGTPAGGPGAAPPRGAPGAFPGAREPYPLGAGPSKDLGLCLELRIQPQALTDRDASDDGEGHLQRPGHDAHTPLAASLSPERRVGGDAPDKGGDAPAAPEHRDGIDGDEDGEIRTPRVSTQPRIPHEDRGGDRGAHEERSHPPKEQRSNGDRGEHEVDLPREGAFPDRVSNLEAREGEDNQTVSEQAVPATRPPPTRPVPRYGSPAP